ncbi:MAG TPA: MFS transporter [Candidatus Limnocylindrales bacterium]|nr:MFS transporter [Candidatus Limnocylindrales bacterium]
MSVLSSALTTLSHSFSPLRERNFSIYLGGQTISMIGSWLQVTAQSWVVWQLTGSEAALGTVTMLQYLPMLLFSPWAGVWADRLDRRKLLISTQVALMALAFITALLVQTGNVQLWHIYILALCVGLINTIDLPAQQAFLGDLVGMGAVRKAVNLNAMMIQVSRMLGPAFAGLLVARVGMAPSFWLNGVSFGFVIVSLVLVRANQERVKRVREGVFLQLRAAVSYLRTQPRMQDMYMFTGLLTFLILSVMFSLLPAYADHVLSGGPDMLGLLMSASGAGALLSVIFIVPLVQARKRAGLILGLALTWSGLWMTVFALANSVPLALAALFMVSLGNPIVFTMALGLIQIMSPHDMRARMLSLYTMISFGLQPIAALVVGNTAEHWGVGTAILINAILLLVGAFGMLFLRRGLRTWEVPIQSAPTVAPAAAIAEQIAVPEL